MALTVGSILGAYEILAPLGSGGMGEVYRAKDARLGREVALKILPDTFAQDPERLARFRREAQVLASLNHPHIGAIYGIEEANGRHFLVLELVDGQSLDQRIARGPLSLDEAKTVALQIVDALEAAHEKGIVHRDLKPANVALTHDGAVKVLDFGLAKAIEPVATTGNVTNSPTITSPALGAMTTGVGVILGTAAYMAPEQAKGQAADKRSDVWAFGCVLYEMLTGKRPFEGDDVSETLASVLKSEPDPSALRSVPPSIRALIDGCLRKDRRERIGDLSVARFLLTHPLAMDAHKRPGSDRAVSWTHTVPWIASILLLAALIGTIAWRPRSAEPGAVARFVVQIPPDQMWNSAISPLIAISHDGTQIAYSTVARLFVRALSDLDARPIASVDTQRGATHPVFSPDGRSIAFFSPGEHAIQRVSTSGGSATTICPADRPFGMTWDGDDILFAESARGRAALMRVPADGGKPEALVRGVANEYVQGAQLLPGGDALLFTVVSASFDWDRARIVVQPLPSGPRRTIVEGGSSARYLPSGHIVYAVGGTLFAVPFDGRRLRATGRSVPVIEGVAGSYRAGTGVSHFSVADNGTVVYLPGPPGAATAQRQLTLVDRYGHAKALNLPADRYVSPRISPDGKRLLYGTDGSEKSVWIYELSGAAAPRRLTFGGDSQYPIWSADGQRVAFQSTADGDVGIFWQRANGSGTPERLTKADKDSSHIPESWSPDGRGFTYSVVSPSGVSLWTYSIGERKSTRFGDLQSTGLLNSEFSPDGKWLAYTIRNPPNAAVFMQPVPPTGAVYQISKNDLGHHPMWSRDGKQLFYRPGGNALVRVNVTTAPAFAVSQPVPESPAVTGLSTPQAPRDQDIAPDGSTFVVVGFSEPTERTFVSGARLYVILNWFEELKARAPVK